MMRKILVAPDSFKGSMTATKVCQIIAETIKSMDESCVVDMFPMADGGEGTVEAIVFNKDGIIKKCSVQGPLGISTQVTYGITGNSKVAIMEMAEASGITLLTVEERDPLETSTYGVGEMILNALDEGCEEILLGIGGSATNDGGIGMLSALGYQFLDKSGNMLKACGKNLELINSINDGQVDSRLKKTNFYVACDVDNPLIGSKGATYIYGPQKGGTPKKLKILEEGMINYAKIVKDYRGIEVAHLSGAGAAGGLGAALVAFLGATLESGFKMVSEAVELEDKIREGKYDLIITGEGQINYQTLHGKLPFGVASLGKKYNTPVIGIVGSIGVGYEPILDLGMTSVFSIMNRPMSLQTAMAESETLLSDTVRRIYKMIRYLM